VPIGHGRFGAVASSHLGRVGLDLMLAALASDDQRDGVAAALPSVIGEPGWDFKDLNFRIECRVWITALFTPDRITAAFTVVLALATLALVGTAYFQHQDAVEAIQATQRLAVATENTAKDSRQTTSAELILKIGAMLEEHRYDRISDDIQSHDSNYHLPKYKNKLVADLEEYIGIFEDMGYFIKDKLISPKMAYDHFSYDIEKAWCNTDVQEAIRKARATDKSKTASTDPMYGNFERLTKEYLDNEGQSCSDLDKQ
jgi:hypothetical protein